ncbi:MAG: UDP-N-acetylglucosamine 2-epimerase (non-hydrolyzing) [Runella slithyformis]|nr:MAG: UDP-N-acetylglucosamine 2-epimerase (non-hydrolyzing) [Runella slithyformis]
MKILNIVGARPNFMKVAPLHRAFGAYPHINSKIIHTGQHYDAKMSDVFFNQLELPKPDYFLGVGGGSHTQQTAKIMLEFEQVMEAEKPDLLLVVGDVNSTIACAMVAVKMQVPIAHVEAGLRSGDRKMPEEINRILTDSISDYLFITEQAGYDNLRQEGVSEAKIHFVGNCMIDSLVHYQAKARKTNALQAFNLSKNEYVLMTMHRPANVDTAEGLTHILDIIEDTLPHKKVLFPIHPRTRNNAERFGLKDKLESLNGLIISEPQGYLEFLNLMENAAVVITDSGGIQEETTYLQVPCLTFRDSTERPVTVELGTNQLLADLNPATVHQKLREILDGRTKQGTIPPLWDGQAAQRIAQILSKLSN